MAEDKQLTVHNASVTTMSVEVKALKIGARQVTQGIFRQLIEEPLIAEDGTLNGNPWGYVTWHPDKCDRDREHWHIVWQNGTELRRSTVATTPAFDPHGHRYAPVPFQCDEAEDCLDGAVREWLLGRSEKMPLARQHGLSSGAPCANAVSWSTEHGFTVEVYPSDTAVTAAKAKLAAVEAADRLTSAEAEMNKPLPQHSREEWRQESLKRARENAEATKAALADAGTLLEAELGQRPYRDLVAAFQAATQAEAERRQRHRDVRTELGRLPQLFIGG